MAAGDSALSICSDALLMLGASAIASFNEGTDAANICDRLYPDIRDQAITMYPWSFSVKKVKLSRLLTTPVNEYKYEYQLPGDRLAAPKAVYYSGSINIPVGKDYKIVQDSVYTNYEEVWIDYQYSVPEFDMPVYFVQLLKYLMAWHLALPITDQEGKAQYWQTIASGTPGENGRGGYFRTAMNIDGGNQTSNFIGDYSLIAVRY